MTTPHTANLELPSAQALQSSEQMRLLDAVDSLRAHGLGEITALPQLVVCGDQSSGKSSVLEAISGVPFPRKANVCTRFATEVILRRSRAVRMSVSIVPSEDAPVADRERLLQFQHEVTSIEDFAELFEKAKETMGIANHKKTFSKDILKVEFCGPTQPQLTLVDLPGLFHAEINGQTKEDIKIVEDLVSSYLKNPRSIILAIISAKYDLNNQVILRRTRELDPQGKRTLGIITKPDAIDNLDDEGEFIRAARNERVVFQLGWHVVRNMPSGSENAQQHTRDEQEAEFFRDSNFSILPKKDVGIDTLRTRLSNVLFDQIKVELPRLVEDIESRVRAGKAARDRLGPGRSTVDEQRTFLIELSESFQTICQFAIAGHYDHDFFRGAQDEERRLCANLMNKHFEFATSLERNGAAWKIVDKEDDEHDSRVEYADDSGDERDDERNRTREEAIEEACKLLKRSRGRELPGLPNSLLVGELFREYSRPWAGLARSHITDVWNVTKRFLELVLQYITDDDVCDKILRHCLDPIMEQSRDLAEEKLQELLDVHKDHPLTTNHDFIDNRRNLQQERNKEETNPHMDLVAAEDAFENMNAYYMVAMKLFMDNVPTLAIQAPIVRKLPAMLSPVAVSKMDAESIRRIAGESEEKVREREEILRRLDKLETGARICKEYALRRSSVSRPAEGSSNIEARQIHINERPGKGKGRPTFDRRHSPSVSEDGRATSGNEDQRSGPAFTTRPSNTLNVPETIPFHRPASTGGVLFGASSPSPAMQTAAGKPTPGEPSGFSFSKAAQSSTGTGLFGATTPRPSSIFTAFGSSSTTTGTGVYAPQAPSGSLFSGTTSGFGGIGNSAFGSTTKPSSNAPNPIANQLFGQSSTPDTTHKTADQPPPGK